MLIFFGIFSVFNSNTPFLSAGRFEKIDEYVFEKYCKNV